MEHEGITPDQLATRADVGRSTIFNWLKRDTAPPSKSHRASLVQIFGCSPDYLVHGFSHSREGTANDAPANYGENVENQIRNYVDQLIEFARGGPPEDLPYILRVLKTSLPLSSFFPAEDAGEAQVLDELRRRRRASLARGESPSMPPTPPQTNAPGEEEGGSSSKGGASDYPTV